MNHSPHEASAQPPLPSGTHGTSHTRSWRRHLAFWLLLGIAGFYLVTEHGSHLLENLGWLPFVLILACPLIHLFGHGHHGGHRPQADPRDGPTDQPVGNGSEGQEPADRPHDHSHSRGGRSS